MCSSMAAHTVPNSLSPLGTISSYVIVMTPFDPSPKLRMLSSHKKQGRSHCYKQSTRKLQHYDGELRGKKQLKGVIFQNV